jgi:hypothetical protein
LFFHGFRRSAQTSCGRTERWCTNVRISSNYKVQRENGQIHGSLFIYPTDIIEYCEGDAID